MATKKTRKTKTKTVVLHVWGRYDRECMQKPVNLRISGETNCRIWKNEEQPDELLHDVCFDLSHPGETERYGVTKNQARKIWREFPNGTGKVFVD